MSRSPARVRSITTDAGGALAKRAKHGVERGRVGHAAIARDSQAVTRVAESGLEPHRMRPG